MGRKGKDKGTAPAPLPPAPPIDMSREERMRRLLGLGMTQEEIDRQFAVTGDLTIAPTTLCIEHVFADGAKCRKCGKPLGVRDFPASEYLFPKSDDPDTRRISAELGRDRTDEWEERIDAARQSGNVATYPLSVLDELGDDNALDSFLTEDEKQAPYAAVLTPEQLDAVLNAPEPPPEPKPTPPDGWQHILVAITPQWHERAVKMANGQPMTEYVERLIKRQWIASGGGKR